MLSTRWNQLPSTLTPIGTLLLSLTPSSVAFTDWPDGSIRSSLHDSWIVFRGANQPNLLLGEPCCAGEFSEADWIAEVDGLPKLISEFGNLQIGMLPPCFGFRVGGRLVHQSDTELCWGVTGDWENALPIFHDGSGNTICVSTDGKVGIRSPHQFQNVATTLGDFVTMFVKRQRTGKSPQREWWW